MPATIVFIRWFSLVVSVPLTIFFVMLLNDNDVAKRIPFFIPFGIAAGLMALEFVYSKKTAIYKDQLYSLLKEFGENMTEGLAVESAVQKACGWKKVGPAPEFNRALKESASVPFVAALTHVGAHSGQQSFREVAGLVALSVRSGGDVGGSLRWLGHHFATLRGAEKEFMAAISSSVSMMRGIGLVVAPFMYQLLARTFAQYEGHLGYAPLNQSGVNFYAFGAVGMAMLEGLVYGKWWGVPPRLPFYLGLIYFCLRLQ